ncbi:MAG TPA: hypothetical protein V6D22_01000 [Candidatus Obscuribacterales bacterium]
MAIIQALLSALTHSASKILNTIFSWATVLLFGRVTERKQILMSLACAASVLWLLAVISLIFPLVGVFLLAAFVPPQAAAHKNAIRLGMLAAAIVIPFIVGALALVGRKDSLRGVVPGIKAVFSGWPYTIGLSLTMMLMIIFAPVMKLTTMAKLWKSQHVPILIKPRDYDAAVEDVEAALHDSGLVAQRRQASWMVSFPTRVLLFFARNQLQDMVANRLTVFTAHDFEIMLHPSDLIISGKEQTVARVRAILARKLAFSHAYLTWTEDANKVEQRMRTIWMRVIHGDVAVIDDLRGVEQTLSRLDLDYDEWQVLFREKAQIEHEILAQASPGRRRRAS